MKVNKSLLIIIYFLFYLNVHSQNLSVIELLQLSNKSDWEAVNTALTGKGWEYYDSKEGDDNNYSIVTWALEKNNYDDKAQGWFKLYTYTGFPNKVSYQFRKKATYTNLKNTLASTGFKYIGTEIKDDQVISKYVNPYFIIELVYIQMKEDENTYSDNTHTSYLITVIKKAGVYDNDNGLKKTYDTNGNLESEFTLKDGKLNGTAKSYYANGQLKVVSNFINGTKQGLSKEYDEYGNPTAEYNYQNGELNGNYKIFENGKLKMSGSLLNATKNGQFKIYDEESLIDKEYCMKLGLLEGAYAEYYYDEGKLIAKITGVYSNDKKTGLWQTNKITDKGNELIEFHTYLNDEKNGTFKEVRKDSIMFGTYKNGVLDGSYKVYINLTAMLLGGLHGDTTNAPLVTTGKYSEGLKNGNWKFYSLGRLLIKEGRYYNDLETGEWKYYFDNYVDERSKPLPYSGKLFLIENYEDGKKSGRETRYASLTRKEVPCDTTNNSNVNPLDTCHQMVYQKIFQTAYFKSDKLHGPFEEKDSIGIVVGKGNFINGKRDGIWLESYVSKDSQDKNYYTFLRGNYINGVETGVWDEFVKEDFIYAKYNYVNGKLNGKTVEYNPNNKPREEKYFDEGKLKILKIYDSLGISIIRSYEILNESDYDIRCCKTEFNSDGKISQVYLLRKNDGETINHNFFEFMFILKTGKYSNGSNGYPDGEFKMYDRSDKILIQGTAYKKTKIGKWKFYYYDVNIYTEQEYNNDIGGAEKYFSINTNQQFSGKFVQKFDNGKLKYEFKISDGLRDGKSKYFDENGKVVNTQKYDKGVLQN